MPSETSAGLVEDPRHKVGIVLQPIHVVLDLEETCVMWLCSDQLASFNRAIEFYFAGKQAQTTPAKT